MKYLLAVLALTVSLTSAQAGEPKDVTAKYIGRDFATLLMPKTEFLGFIDPNYQRLQIHFASVTRDKANPAIYRVKGFSLVKENRCDFEGTITVGKLTLVDEMHFGVDDEYKDKGIKAEGQLSGSYEFKENSKQAHSGVFRGVVRLDWYIDRHGSLTYDRIEVYSDGYDNNQYTGVWVPYGNPAGKKTANWGEFRIPNSGDLDSGAAEFHPNGKYDTYGWREYRERQERGWKK